MKSNATPMQRLIVALLTLQLSFGAVPAQAWADEVQALLNAQEPAQEQVAAGQAESKNQQPAEDVGQTPSEEQGQPEEGQPEEGQSEEGQPEEGQAQDGQPEEGQSQEGDQKQVVATGQDGQGADQATQAEGTSETPADEAALSQTQAQALTSQADPQKLTVTASVVGIDADGKAQTWAKKASYEMSEGATAADVTEAMLNGAGLTHDSGTGTWGYYLNTITSPDGTRTLGWDQATGRYWQLFVNGAASDLGAGSVALTDGMAITWCYSAYGDPVPETKKEMVTATCEFIGPDGAWSVKREATLEEGATAADLTEQALAAAGLTHASSVTQYGYYLESITSPDGQLLAYDPDTWRYWQLFVDGTSSDLGASSVTLTDGMVVTWCYSAYGDSIPSASGTVTIDPDAERPSYEAEWSGYKGTDLSGTTTASTPTEKAELAWSTSLLASGASFANVSDPIIVNGDVYIAADTTLYQLDAITGSKKAQAPLAKSISYTCRPRYADGLILVPLEGGGVQAITAGTLACVWVSDELPQLAGWGGTLADQQNSSTVLTHGGYAYLGTTDGMGSGGSLLCLSLQTGATRWASSSTAGYYWAGCAMTDAGLVVADDNGLLSLIDPVSGEVKATLQLANGCRASIVAAGDGSTVYAVTKDGVLRKVSIAESTLAEKGTLQFAASSTTTPTIVGTQMIVAGMTDAYKGTLSVVDLTTLTLTQTVAKATDQTGAESEIVGDIKSAPLVAKTDNGTYVYFTANNIPGGLYMYKLGEALASLLYTPASAQQNYCMASPIAGSDGTLYYTNDSASIFALKASSSDDPSSSEEQGSGSSSSSSSGSSSSGDSSSSSGDGSSDSTKKATKLSAYIRVRSNAFSLRPNLANTLVKTTAKPDGTAATDKATKADKATAAETADKDDKQGAKDDDAATTGAAADGVMTTGATSAAQAEGAASAAARTMPIWPFVGIAIGCAALAWVVLGKRRNDNGTKE